MLSFPGCGHVYNCHGMQLWSGLFNRVMQTIACPMSVGILVVSCQRVIQRNIATANIFSLLSQTKYSPYELKCSVNIFLHVGRRACVQYPTTPQPKI